MIQGLHRYAIMHIFFYDDINYYCLFQSLDSAFLRRFSTYLHVAQPEKEDRIEILKNVANGFHSLTKEDFSNLGDMTNHYSAADIARAGNDSINWYFQELLIATRFKETPDKDGKMKFEPCTINEEGTTMTYKDLEDSQLHHRKLTFHCMEEVLRQSRPTIESTEVNKHRRFEMKHPGVSIYRWKEMLDLKEKEEVHKSEKRSLMKIFKSIFNKHEIEKKSFERDSVKTSAQSDAANKNQRLSLFKSSKDHCKNTEPKKLATKEKHINQQPASSLSKNANESTYGFNDKPCSESKNDDDSSSGFDDESSSDSDESYIDNHSAEVPFCKGKKKINPYNKNQ